MYELSQMTVKNLLVERLRNEIICGNFVPGQRLRLRDLADQFRVSTQPIREALSDLEAEGLITSEPRKGALVTLLTAEELQDIYDIRATLEAMATRLAAPHLTTADFHKLDTLIAEMDRHAGEVVKLVQFNFEFHMTLYAASGRKHLCELNATLRHRTAHYLHAYMIDQGGMPLAQEEHRAIVAACRQQDAEKASAIMYRHVAEAGQGIIKYARRLNTPTDEQEQ
jgi:DNA-binding GntR family transcriptional regulator